MIGTDLPARQIALWITLWLATGGLFVWLVRRGINYLDRFWMTSAYFLAAAGLVVGVFSSVLRPKLAELNGTHFALFAAAFLLQAGIRVVVRRNLRRPSTFIEAHPHIYFLRFDARYLVSKPCEILYQQMLLGALAMTLRAAGFEPLQLALICAVLFGLVHVPLIPVHGTGFGLFYTGFAALGAGLFSYLVVSVEGGLFCAYMIHWFFYTLSGIAIWLALQSNATQETPRSIVIDPGATRSDQGL